MLRFIIRKKQQCTISGLETDELETIDIDVPVLESILGGGISENGYLYNSVEGVEVLPQETKRG